MSKISAAKSQEYIDNWNDHWQNYLLLNSDLKEAGINCKRKSKNHYIKHGISECRQVEKDVVINSLVHESKHREYEHREYEHREESIIPSKPVTYTFVLQKSMFHEAI